MSEHGGEPNPAATWTVATIGGWRYEKTVALAAGSLVCLRIHLDSGDDFGRLANHLAELPDVAKLRPFEGATKGTGYQFAGDGFLASLLHEPDQPGTATLLVETVRTRPPRHGAELELWDYLVDVREPIPTTPPPTTDEAPDGTAAINDVGTSSITVGQVQFESVGGSVHLTIAAAGSPGTRAALDGDETAELHDVLGTVAVRALRYCEAIEERRTKPQGEWQYIEPERILTMYPASYWIGDHVRINWCGNGVELAVYGDDDGDLQANALFTANEAYDLAEPLLKLATRATMSQ